MRHTQSFREYAYQTTELYRAIADVSGRPIIVDSSAIPMRALALSLMPEIDLKLIHMVRDGRGVAWSLKKGLQANPQAGVCTTETPRPVWRSAMTWLAYNLTSSWVCRQLPRDRVFFCRYEDLSTNSEPILREMGRFLQADFDDVIRQINHDQPLKVGCTFGGNRMRMRGEVKLRLDTEWTVRLSAAEQRTLSRMCGWLMRRYGYHLEPVARKAG
jgi:hypothetical protein